MVSHKKNDAGPGPRPGNHTVQFAHLTKPGKAVTTSAVGSQEQKLWAWREGSREAEAATHCTEGKRLAKAFHDGPVSHMSKSSFQLEAKAYHRPDPSQISQPLGKHCYQNSPCPQQVDSNHWQVAQPIPCHTDTCQALCPYHVVRS